MKGRDVMSRSTNLPSKYEQKQIYSKQIKFRNIDMGNILKITPSELFNSWKYNTDITRRRIVEMQSEIRALNSELNHVRKGSRREKITKKIDADKIEMSKLDRNLKIWLDNVQQRINNTVKLVFKKLLSNATEDQISNIVIEFGNVFSKSKYANTTLENILINFINDYKRGYTEARNSPMNLTNEMIPSIMNQIDTRRKKVEVEPMEYNDRIDDYHRGLPNEYKSDNNDMRYFGVSICYSSLGKKPIMRNTGKRSFELMMLGALDAVSNMLYGNLQNALEDLYEKIDDKDITDVNNTK